MEKQKIYDVHQLWMIYKSHKRWFLLSLLICLCIGLSYLFWTKPAFSITGKIQIIERRNSSSVSASAVLQNQLPFGLGNSLGGSSNVETEKEILKSRLIARDAVMDLGLYTEYRNRKWFRSRLVYKNNPINVTVDESTLKVMDENLPMVAYAIRLSIDKDENGYRVNGYVKENKDKTELQEIVTASLPTVVKTSIGDLTLAENKDLKVKDVKRYAKGYHLDVIIVPPMTQARIMAKRLALNPPSKKTSSVLLIDFKDENILRGIDYVNAIVEKYNMQSNEQKHREAAKNDEFVNERLAKIDAELSFADEKWESSKKRFQVTEAKVDAEEVMGKKSAYESQLVNFGVQLQLLDYLREYVNNPANFYELIPVNAGVYSGDAVSMITRHNQLVNDRNLLLKSITEHSAQVKLTTQLIDELHPVILTAFIRDRESLLLRKQAAEREYNKYMSRVGSAPEQERVLTEIGRDRNIKQGVYVSLLQKREENAMEIARTTDKGRLVDATLFNKKVKPRVLIVLLLVIVISMLLPFLYYFLREWLKGVVENSDDLRQLSELPVIGEIPVDGPMAEEAFHSIRASLIHWMRGGQKRIMVTSDSTADGKTYTAIHLAKALSATGKKVVLCDLNLRNPSVGKLLNVQGKGWCDILSEDALTSSDILSVVQKTVSGVPDVLLAGQIPSVHPATLLAHDHLGRIIACLKEVYDFVILDTSGVGQYDEVLVDGLADVTCFVCRSGKTLKTAINHLNQLAVEARLMSPVMVLNLG